jgi:hypothetical protein
MRERNHPPYSVWFMESLLPLSRMHWNLEPMAIPLTRPTDTLSPIGGEGQGGGDRFMEGPLGFDAVHWDHEPTPDRCEERT